QGACIHTLFEAQVERTPDALALVFEDQQVTYRQLDARANDVAHELRLSGVVPEVRVAVCLERSIELVVGVLAILKAGGAYVPLDPSYPVQRLAWMLEDAKAPVLVTQERLASHLPPHRAHAILLDAHRSAPRGERRVHTDVDSMNLAYVIYTSGST